MHTATGIWRGRALQAVREKYPSETEAQHVRHLEIDRRHRRARRGSGAGTSQFWRVRFGEINSILMDRYGDVLPDDDAAREDIEVLAQHFAQVDDAAPRTREWLAEHAPWFSEADIDELICRSTRNPQFPKADAIAAQLGLRHVDRDRLDVHTIGAIDCSKAEREKLARKKDAARKRQERREAGATPRELSAARTEPWKALGVSKSSYYRKRRHETGETNSSEVTPKELITLDETVSRPSGAALGRAPVQAGYVWEVYACGAAIASYHLADSWIDSRRARGFRTGSATNGSRLCASAAQR